MNQIIFSNDTSDYFENNLNVTQNTNIINKKRTYKSYLFKCIFILSNTISLIFFIYYIWFNHSINENEKISKSLSTNFEVKTLYSSNQDYSTTLDVNNYVIGIIEINSIGISYPIISESTDDNLKIAPCRFLGPNPNEIGNLCIVAHNYNNYKFFSKLYKLNTNNIISIYDLKGSKIDYYVYDKYEVNFDNLDCTNQDTNGYREITLITCNNVQDTKRIVVKAIEKKQ